MTNREVVLMHEFAQQVADFYADLLEGQEPLGAEFEAVLFDNVESLYED